MAITVYFKKESKRRNSTLQFALNSAQQFSCALKSATSVDRPTFLLSATSFDYNLAHWDGRYYFVENITSVRDGQWEVSCVIDVLATFKSDILSTSQFVAYASDQSLKNSMLADTRIPILKKFDVLFSECDVINANLPFDPSERTYILTVNGNSGTESYFIDYIDLQSLLGNIATWTYSLITGFDTQDMSGTPYDFSTIETSLESLGKMLNQSGFLGNAYADVTNNIISCIGLPFNKTQLNNVVGSANTHRIHLGQYDTGIDAYYFPYASGVGYFSNTLSIPTTYTDWRKGALVDYCVGLPAVGNVTIPSDLIGDTHEILVITGINFITGDVTYTLAATHNPNDVLSYIIGVYSGNMAESIPIGISQRASLGQIAQTTAQGITKTVSALINPFNPTVLGGLTTGALAGVESLINVANTASTYTNTTISKCAGGTGYAITKLTLGAIEHKLTQNQDSFAVRMGYPVQAVISLTGISGYVQCANAHAVVAAQASEIDAIDAYLNSGFYIE